MARDLDRVLGGLRGHLDDGDRITGIEPLSTGHSNETYLLRGIDLILRTPPSEEGLLPPYDMARQHAVFSALSEMRGAPRVPRPRQLCTDVGVIGDPFFLMERIAGEAFEYEVPRWLAEGTEEVRSEVCRQWIEALARIHSLPPLDCLGPCRTPAEEAERWRDVAAGAGAGELADVLQELVDDPPPTSGPPTLLWGDPKLANCLWDGEGRLQAVVDWELAYNGEPLADLGYVLFWFPEDPLEPRQPGFELDGMWSRSRVIEAWERLTGRRAHGAGRHEAAAIGKIGAIIAVGAQLYTEGRATDPRMAAWVGVSGLMAELARGRMRGSSDG